MDVNGGVGFDCVESPALEPWSVPPVGRTISITSAHKGLDFADGGGVPSVPSRSSGDKAARGGRSCNGMGFCGGRLRWPDGDRECDFALSRADAGDRALIRPPVVGVTGLGALAADCFAKYVRGGLVVNEGMGAGMEGLGGVAVVSGIAEKRDSDQLERSPRLSP